jgi:arabinofuranosyltransferase
LNDVAAWRREREDFWTLPSRRQVTIGGCIAYALLLVRTAWLSDDAYITFRTVMNALHGYGLRWNVADRVQTFTHPLWMLVMLVSSFITRDVYFTSLALSIAFSILAVGLVTDKLASSLPMALVAFAIFGVSKSFVEFSTSGLENPLTHLLLALFFVASASTGRGRRGIFVLSLLASLLMLNRLDTALLVFPALGVRLWQARASRPWASAILGMLPLAAWEIFSVVYYGFPFPNTAYAKLGPGVPRGELLYQGGLYLLDSINNDPITLLVILVAVFSSWAVRRGWATSAGIGLYVTYVIWVGGDFMSGRFLSAPLFCSVVQICRNPLAPRFSRAWLLSMLTILLVGIGGPRPTIASDTTFGDIAPDEAIPPSHITDERRYYYKATGLLRLGVHVKPPDHRWLHLGEEDSREHLSVATTDAAGFVGYGAGPSVRLIDKWGLGDALIARLPAEVPWQIGHFTRRIPAGYELTLMRHENVIRDPGVAAFYEKMRIITEEPVWSRQRFETIVAMNLGRYNHFITSYGLIHTSFDALDQPVADGAEWNAPPAHILTLRGLLLSSESARRGGTVEVTVSGNDDYRLEFRLGTKMVGVRKIRQPVMNDGTIRTSRVQAPGTEWNAVAITPSGGDSLYSVAHVRVLNDQVPLQKLQVSGR